MKKNITILFLILIGVTNPILSQNKNIGRAKEFKNEMWNSSDPAFKITSIPDKWKNESAVILAQYASYEYKKTVMITLLQDNQVYQRRIKLLDKAAVDEYSEMNIPGDDYYMGIKLLNRVEMKSKLTFLNPLKWNKKLVGNLKVIKNWLFLV